MHSRTIGRARASEKFEIVEDEDEDRLIERFQKYEKFEIGNDGEDEDRLIERFKKYEKFEAKLVA